ncbi:MAG: MmcQ/YjbR family DNA-binding protein [Chitinophagales bacterium]|nr:MmcQ/YjbR family DNA-binding protein [Chitinophagales bacterium]
MLNHETLRSYCLNKKGVTEDFPFDEDTLVFKVMGKMFLLTGINNTVLHFNAKMDPELIPQYRDKYADIQPGYHMHKDHWNTIIAGNNKIPQKELLWMIDHSYEQVIKGLSKKERDTLAKMK